jgi:hypothetical protein
LHIERKEANVPNWTDTGDGSREKTIKRGNVTIVIRRPVLPEKERKKREHAVENALAAYARATNPNT